MALVALSCAHAPAGSHDLLCSPQELEPGHFTREDGSDGGLSRDLLGNLIRSHADEVKACYENALATRADLRGDLTLFWVIDPGGRVTRCCVAQTTFSDLAVPRCVVERVRTWRFPEPIGRGNVTVTFPYVFRPAELKPDAGS